MENNTDLKLCWYLSQKPTDDVIFEAFEALSQLFSMSVNRISFHGDSLKTVIRKFSKTNIEKLLQSSTDEHLYLEAFFMDNSEDIRIPLHSISLTKLSISNVNAYVITLSTRLTNGDIQPSLVHESGSIVSLNFGIANGFGYVCEAGNIDFQYSAFSVNYVENPSHVYNVLLETNAFLRKDRKSFLEFLEGKRVRSIYKYNFITNAFIGNLVDFKSESQLYEIESKTDKSFLFLIRNLDEQKRIFDELRNLNLTVDLEWVNLEAYNPQNKLTSY